jgi:hypothetical protein
VEPPSAEQIATADHALGLADAGLRSQRREAGRKALRRDLVQVDRFGDAPQPVGPECGEAHVLR